MTRLVRALMGVIALALASTAGATGFADAGIGRVALVSDYDLSSGSYIFCTTAGPNGVFDTPGYVGPSRVSTSGSSTTVARQTSTDPSPYTNVAVGDELMFVYPGVSTYFRYVSAKASANSITVNAAVDLSNGAGFYSRKLSCGTAATDGWVPYGGGFASLQFDISIDQLNATSIDVKVECRSTGSVSSPVQVFQRTVTAASQTATNPMSVIVSGNYDECRAGYKINGDAGVQKMTVFVGARR